MEYRKANFSDVEQLAKLRVLMLNENTLQSKNANDTIFNNTRQYLNNGLVDNSVILYVALEDDLIVAMCCLNFFVLPPNDWCLNGKTAYIGNLYTLPDYRKRGVASCLLDLTVTEAKRNNCERILLNTTEKGRSLYEKYGFEKSLTAMALYPFGIAQ
ncbi:MAG: acetyltransferase, family [Herbinix sp.]|jgi:ribosomal protein S18 acetylase RimI-like enzyme|nr:acetyltransferase, family [Herbinix sp.]